MLVLYIFFRSIVILLPSLLSKILASLKLPLSKCLSYYRNKEKTLLMLNNDTTRRIYILTVPYKSQDISRNTSYSLNLYAECIKDKIMATSNIASTRRNESQRFTLFPKKPLNLYSSQSRFFFR